MKHKLDLALALAVGLVGGSVLSHSLLTTVFAQTPTPFAQRTTLTTGQGTKVGDFEADQGTIKLSPVVKVRVTRGNGTVTLELSPDGNSK